MRKKVLILIVVIILSLFIRQFILMFISVEGISMEPTLYDKDTVLISKIAYIIDNPKKGDIIVLNEPIENKLVIKRIVGCPGEKVTYQNKSYLLKEDEYFIRGDNKQYSKDSDTYGPIKRTQIKGKSIIIFSKMH